MLTAPPHVHLARTTWQVSAASLALQAQAQAQQAADAAAAAAAAAPTRKGGAAGKAAGGAGAKAATTPTPAAKAGPKLTAAAAAAAAAVAATSVWSSDPTTLEAPLSPGETEEGSSLYNVNANRTVEEGPGARVQARGRGRAGRKWKSAPLL
jgi:hypothetical protein